MSAEEFRSRQNARGVGAAIGATLVAAAIGGKEIGAAILFWMAANPDRVQQIAAGLQETGGGPPGMISGVGTSSKAEWSIAQKLAAEGKNVEILAAQGVGKTADFVVNGAKLELKTLGEGATGSTLKIGLLRELARVVAMFSWTLETQQEFRWPMRNEPPRVYLEPTKDFKLLE